MAIIEGIPHFQTYPINDTVSVLPYPPALGLTTAEGQNSNIICELTVQTVTE